MKALKDPSDEKPETTKHWAFVPPQRPEVPRVETWGSARNPIDSFIEARLQKENITMSPEADRHTLLRRVTLDINRFASHA